MGQFARRVAESLKPNLKLLPELADGIVHSAQEHGLPLATLIGILVRNDSIAPVDLSVLDGGRLARVSLALHQRPALLRLVKSGAKRTGLSQNAYYEALIARHLSESGQLVVLKSKGLRRL